jgi:hypothetical protein
MCSGGVLSIHWRRASGDRAALARSIRGVRRTPISALACAALVLGAGAGPVYAGGRALSLEPLGRHAPARIAAHRGPSVSAVLLSLERSGSIPEAAHAQYYSAYVTAKHSLARLRGTRAVELGAVLSNVQMMASTGQLSASRLPAVFLTLERNTQWWTSEPLLSSSERLSFPSSKLVWEYYPGQGIEIQWLATFGRANGFFLSGHENANLRQLLGEAIPLASKRAGGIAWEYLFRFDGGVPPWTSGLSQGTGLQVLARAWQRFKEPVYLTAAQQALGVFQTPPAQGVRVGTAARAMYAEYTYAPRDRILNGFIQALVGLYDYAAITKDPLGLQLFEAGDAQARAEVPHFDTGAWSLYDQFGESNLNYHELLAEFLQHLCERTGKGLPFTPASAPPPPPATTTAPAPAGGTPGSGGAPAAVTTGTTPPPPSPAIAADLIYCTTAQRFSADLHTPPAIALLSKTLRGGSRAGVQVSLSKISTVGLTIRKGTRVVWTNRATVAAGKPKLLWVTPAAGGTFSVTLSAADLAGNFSTAIGTIVVTRH